MWSQSQLYLVTDTHTQLMLKNTLTRTLIFHRAILLLFSSSLLQQPFFPVGLEPHRFGFPSTSFSFANDIKATGRTGSTSDQVSFAGRLPARGPYWPATSTYDDHQSQESTFNEHIQYWAKVLSHHTFLYILPPKSLTFLSYFNVDLRNSSPGFLKKKTHNGTPSVLDWPLQSLDLSITEAVRDLDREPNKRQPTSKGELCDVLQEAWRTIHQDYLKKFRGEFRLWWRINVWPDQILTTNSFWVYLHARLHTFQ